MNITLAVAGGIIGGVGAFALWLWVVNRQLSKHKWPSHA